VLKLIELVEKSLEYDPETESCKSSFLLREFFVNPDYIISMRENFSLRDKADAAALVDGMDKNISFTEISYAEGSRHGPKIINVIGRPIDILEKYKRH
jgi:hypothetical protein